MIEVAEARRIVASMVLEAQSMLIKILDIEAETLNTLNCHSEENTSSTASPDPHQLMHSPLEFRKSEYEEPLSRKRSREYANKPKESLSPEQLEAKRAADRMRQQKYRIKLKQRMTPEAYAKKLESDRRRKQESRKRLKMKQQGNGQDMSAEDCVSTEEDASDSSSEITAYNAMPNSMEGTLPRGQYLYAVNSVSQES